MFHSNLKNFVIFYIVIFVFQVDISKAKSIPEGYYRGDAIVTKWPTESLANSEVSQKKVIQESSVVSNEPGWVRKQLLKFGQVASKIGGAMGGHANKITAALDKICEVVKTVIPLLAAVCHVGEFGFCTATNEAPIKLVEAMNPNDLNLDILDR